MISGEPATEMTESGHLDKHQHGDGDLHVPMVSSVDQHTEDEWSENEDGEEVSPGQMDTMLTAPDFLEDHERDLVFNVAPGEGATPLSVFRDKYCEELAYPNIFLGQRRPENSERTVPVYYSEICKAELRHEDRRVAKDVDNLFFKTKKLQMKQMLDKATIAIRKCKPGSTSLTARAARDTNNIKDLVFRDVGYKFMNTLRGTPPYFQKLSKDLYAMCRQLGPATLFVTFSAAETRWPHLLRILGQVVDGKLYTDDEIKTMSWDQKCRLIQSDPVTCARHFDYTIQQMFRLLKSDHSPLGKLKDFAYRIEFQQRGSPHCHAMLWLEDCVSFTDDTDDDITNYIDQLMTCEKPSEATDEQMSNLVNLQYHRHSYTCRTGSKLECRFGFPKPPMSATIVLEPFSADEQEDIVQHKKNWTLIHQQLKAMKLGEDITFEIFLKNLQMTEENYIKAVRTSLKSRTIFLKRSPNEIRVNSYNTSLLRAIQSNMDVQPVLSTYACATYIASYISKGQRGMSQLLRKAAEEAKQVGSNIQEQFRSVGNSFLNAVEISAQEACYLLLQLPLRQSSRQVIFVNTSLPEDRVFLLKPRHILQSMDDEDEEVSSTSLIKRYEERPPDLQSVCLAEFACWYNRTKKYVAPRIPRESSTTTDGLLPEEVIIHPQNDDCEELPDELPPDAQEYRRRKVIISILLHLRFLLLKCYNRD